MFDRLAEHIADTAPCNSRFDGFDRGDTDFEPDQPTFRWIGRMTSEAGYRVSILETQFAYDTLFDVFVDGRCVFCEFDNREGAIRVARWWMDGCPA